MVINYGTDSYTQEPNPKVVRRLLPFLWPAGEPGIRMRVGLSLVFLLLGRLASVWIPICFKIAVDRMAAEEFIGPSAVPVALLLAYGSARAFSVGFTELKDILFAQVEYRAVRQVAVRLFTHLHRLGLRFHMDRKTGDVTRSLERGTRGIETFLRYLTFGILPTLLESVLVVGTIGWMYGWYFASIAGGGIALYVYFTLQVTHWRAKFVRRANEEENACSAQAVESLLNYETVKYFNNEEQQQQRYDHKMAHYERASVQNKAGLSALNSGQGIIISACLTVTLLSAAFRVANDALTLGDFVLMNTYLVQLYQPLNILGFAYREMKRSLVDMENMFALFDKPVEIQDKSDAKTLDTAEMSVEFDNVCFGYHTERPILKGLSFQAPAGKRVAIVGPSGAGKSTIARLMFRFYDVTGGAIRVNGHDVRDLTQKSLRSHIGVVPQDMVLFNDTIYYNIQFGRPTASRAEVEAAARAASLETFIHNLPDGYDTLVGERGLKLSGGEKQRVAIARTLLKQPRMFIFDEATSSLDTRTERAIQDQLDRISQGVTTIMIAHRLSTIAGADEIIVLDEGHVAERGTHTELLAQDGLYSDMWRRQNRQKQLAEVTETAEGGSSDPHDPADAPDSSPEHTPEST